MHIVFNIARSPNLWTSRMLHFRVSKFCGFVLWIGLILSGCATTGERITDSLKSGDFARADKIIDDDTTANRYTYEFALSWSIRMKSVDGVKHYLERVPGGVRHRFSHSYGATPLISAASIANNTAVIRFLLDNGAGVNDADSRRMTALDWANYLKLGATANLLTSAGGKANLAEYQYAQLRDQEAREEIEAQAEFDAYHGQPKVLSLPSTVIPTIAVPARPTERRTARCGPGQTYQGTCGEYCAKTGGSAGTYANSPRCIPKESICVCYAR